MPDRGVMRTNTSGRVHRLIILGVLMLGVLVGVLWASGMGRGTVGNPDVGRPTYLLSDNRPSDAAAR